MQPRAQQDVNKEKLDLILIFFFSLNISRKVLEGKLENRGPCSRSGSVGAYADNVDRKTKTETVAPAYRSISRTFIVWDGPK